MKKFLLSAAALLVVGGLAFGQGQLPPNTIWGNPSNVRALPKASPSGSYVAAIPNNQVGTAYTIQTSDSGKLVTANNPLPVTWTLPQATGSFAQFGFWAKNVGTGPLFIVPTTSKINRFDRLTLSQDMMAYIVSDGVDWQALVPPNTQAHDLAATSRFVAYDTVTVGPFLQLSGTVTVGNTVGFDFISVSPSFTRNFRYTFVSGDTLASAAKALVTQWQTDATVLANIGKDIAQTGVAVQNATGWLIAFDLKWPFNVISGQSVTPFMSGGSTATVTVSSQNVDQSEASGWLGLGKGTVHAGRAPKVNDFIAGIFATGETAVSLTTNATTAAGNNTLHFASVPVSVSAGMVIFDNTAAAGVIPANTTVVSVTPTTVVMSANAAGAGVGGTDSITFATKVDLYNIQPIYGYLEWGITDPTPGVARGFVNIKAGDININSNGTWGTGKISLNSGLITATSNVAPARPGPSGTVVQLVGVDGLSAFEVLDSYGIGVAPSYFMRGARGTAANPTAIQSGDFLGSLTGLGYGTTGYGVLAGAQLAFYATQNWTDANQGARACIATTANNTNAVAQRGCFEHSGGFTWPTSVAGGDPGAGGINATVLQQAGVGVATTARNINTTAPLSGGGNLSADRTIALTGTVAVANGGTGDTGTAYTNITTAPSCNTGTLTTAITNTFTKTLGKTVFISSAAVAITTNGTCGGAVRVPVGFTSARSTAFACNDGINGLQGQLIAGNTFIQVYTNTGTYPGGNGITVNCSGIAEST